MPATDLQAIVGLGNPGAGYARTRHNAGWWLLDALAESAGAKLKTEPRFQGEAGQARIGGEPVWLLRPTTFMNRSGQSAQALLAFYRLEPAQVLVLHDELDLAPGVARLKRGGGHGGHNGLRSLHEHLGPDYARLRIGIGHPGNKDLVLDYVLNRPSVADEKLIRDAVARGADAVTLLLAQGWDKAMQQLHSGDPE